MIAPAARTAAVVANTDAFSQRRDKQAYERVRRAELQYGIKLRKLARHCGDIIAAFPPGDPLALPHILKVLKEYAAALGPWANVTAAGMLADVGARDKILWAEVTKGMSQALRHELNNAPTGMVYAVLQARQVELIRSIPLDAAERVHKLTMEGMINSTRASEIANEIRRSGKVSESKATLIARTEVGRASTNLGQARAEYVGSEGYIWRTARDSDVRQSHRLMEGKFVSWSSPPTLDKLTGHAGCVPNCRCYTEIVLPDGYKF